ncbi:MAG: molybdopterin dinucleotide binding domain-containing protein [Candidatus Thorarchaeota archaeon]|jgi:formylmethanofuran dehydrogenase subunit D
MMALGDFLFPHADLKLVVARSFETDIESVKDKFSSEYQDSAAVVRLNVGDLKRLGLKEGNNANLKTKAGSIVVSAIGDDKVPEGVAIVPYGPWALSLVSVPDQSTPPQLHGVAVTVTRTDDNVTSLEKLLERP